MGLETAPQRALNVPMGPLVTPANPESANATVVGDAMRKGFITAEEVVDRIGQRAQAKKAAEIAQSQAAVPVAQAQAMAAQEAMSPQAQAMRAQQMQNAATVEDLKMRALKYDVISKPNQLEPKLALLVSKGIQPPVFGSEGPSTDDIATINKLVGDVMAYDQSVGVAKEIAQKHFQPQIEKTSRTMADGSTEVVEAPVYNTPLGKLDENQFKNAIKHSQQSFASWLAGPKLSAQQAIFGQAPGQVSGGPAPAQALVQPAPVSEEQTDRNRAALVERGGMPIEDVQKLTPEQINNLVQPAASAAPASKPVIEPLLPPGGRVSEVKEAPMINPSAKAATELQSRAGTSMARMIVSDDVIKNMTAAGYNPASVGNSIQDFLVGPLQYFKTEPKRQYDQAQQSWLQGLLRLESGAAISRHEEGWYAKAFFPQIGDNPSVQAQKDLARRSVESVVGELARTGNLDASALLAARQSVEKIVPPTGGTAAASAVSTDQPIQIQAGGGQYNARKMPDGTIIYTIGQ